MLLPRLPMDVLLPARAKASTGAMAMAKTSAAAVIMAVRRNIGVGSPWKSCLSRCTHTLNREGDDTGVLCGT